MASISRTPSIYQIRHIESGKVYVGSAVNPRTRWSTHRHALRVQTHHSQYLQRAWNKYGEDAFVFEIIEPVLFVEDLLAREQYWMGKLRSTERRYGYNTALIAGSNLGIRQTDEQRAAQSQRLKERLTDPVIRAHRSDQARARWENPEYREQMTAKVKLAKNTPAAKANAIKRGLARYANPEERARQSELSKAKWEDPDYRDKVLEARRASPLVAAAQAKASQGSKAYWADPAVRKAKSEAMKARLADPEERRKMSERAKAAHAAKRKGHTLPEMASSDGADSSLNQRIRDVQAK